LPRAIGCRSRTVERFSRSFWMLGTTRGTRPIPPCQPRFDLSQRCCVPEPRRVYRATRVLAFWETSTDAWERFWISTLRGSKTLGDRRVLAILNSCGGQRKRVAIAVRSGCQRAPSRTGSWSSIRAYADWVGLEAVGLRQRHRLSYLGLERWQPVRPRFSERPSKGWKWFVDW